MPYADPEDQKKAQRIWDRQHQKEKIEAKRIRRIEQRRRFAEFKKTLKCSRCSENHPAALDFHHKDPKQKEKALYQIICGADWSWERIMEEVSRCEVLCANCHRKEHYLE